MRLNDERLAEIDNCTFNRTWRKARKDKQCSYKIDNVMVTRNLNEERRLAK